jgi:enoyl-CoA hydratase/carnithine racemase
LAEFVKIEKGLGPEGRIAVVRFDRGDGINALSPEALRQLTDAAPQLRGRRHDLGRGADRA